MYLLNAVCRTVRAAPHIRQGSSQPVEPGPFFFSFFCSVLIFFLTFEGFSLEILTFFGVWDSGCPPVLGTGLRKFDSSHSDHDNSIVSAAG